MSKPLLKEKLLEMASEQVTRSETSRLRDVFSEVEHALERGVSRKAVLAALHEDGFTMSLKMFDKALYRIRKGKRASEGDRATKKRTALEERASQTTPTQTNPGPEAENTERPKKVINNPSDIRKIREDVMKNTNWLELSQPVTKKP